MEKGLIYGVELIEDLPLGTGPMKQAMPSRDDLERVMERNQRTVAGYEVLLAHYQDLRTRFSILHEMADRLRIELKSCVKASRRNDDWPEEEYERLEALCQRAWDSIHGE